MRKTDTDSLALDDATFAQQLEAIIDADFPATTKLILLKIAAGRRLSELRHADASGIGQVRPHRAHRCPGACPRRRADPRGSARQIVGLWLQKGTAEGEWAKQGLRPSSLLSPMRFCSDWKAPAQDARRYRNIKAASVKASTAMWMNMGTTKSHAIRPFSIHFP